MLSDVESRTNLEVNFQSTPSNSYVIAQYKFNPHTNIPTVFLRANWEDVDVAHELMHMRLELVEGYYVLAWRQGIIPSNSIETAFGRIRSYVDDEVVHARLVRDGYRLDADVLKPQLFDDIYTRVPRHLKKLRPRSDDGMAHLDNIGYGELCRSSFLVQAGRILESYGQELPYERSKLVRRFIEAFRTYRSDEADKADKILALFKKHDVQTVNGHKQILYEWAQMEQLDQFVGVSSYQQQNGKFTLPFP